MLRSPESLSFRAVDMNRGCIYHLGVDSGTLIEGNVCTNTSSYYYGGWGYYLDEGSSNVTVRGNLAFNLKTAGFTQHCVHIM